MYEEDRRAAFGPAKGRFGVDEPPRAAQRRERGVESALVGERRQIAEEGQTLQPR